MKINIRKIGNSQGIIIPSKILKQLGKPDTVDLKVNMKEKTIIIKPLPLKNKTI